MPSQIRGIALQSPDTSAPDAQLQSVEWALTTACWKGLCSGPDTMTEVLFYHLERASAQDVLPVLLLKTLERGWRAVVQVRQR
jgi:hypothetical protein